MIGLVSWFIGLQLQVAPSFVGFHLIVICLGFTPGFIWLCNSFMRLCSCMPAELLFLSPTIFW